MKFGKYLKTQINPEFADNYIDYAGLKDVIKRAVHELETGAVGGSSPRETSLTVSRPGNKTRADEEFYDKIEEEVNKISRFVDRCVTDTRNAMTGLESAVSKVGDDPAKRQQLLQQANKIGDDFLALEKYVNLNYMGIHKILKKHDKNLPHATCRQFYIAHLHKQKWLSGDYSDCLVKLSQIFSTLRGDASGVKNEDSAQGFVRSTTKYWVRQVDVSAVKYKVLQQLPVFQFDSANFAGDAQLVNSVYLDNSSAELYHGRLDKRPNAIALRLRWYGSGAPKTVFVERKTHRESWKGEESVKERFVLPEDKVVPFLEGDYKLDEAVESLRARGKSDDEIAKFSELFVEVQKVVDSKQLRPMVRTQYMRTAFQIPFDATVRVSLDTNLTMIKENPDEGPSCTLAGRWYRDPALAIGRTEITRFPHAVLEVKLSLAEGEQAPLWVQELLESGLCTEVHKFSKFIHGTCTLMPDLVQAVPYWVDDESIRDSMLASAPLPVPVLEQAHASSSKPRRVPVSDADDVRHPLLGDEPTLQLIQQRSASGGVAAGMHAARAPAGPPRPNLFDLFLGHHKPRLRSTPMRIEPKTFFANERTFLSWLHMAVTIGSISAALLGFAATADRTGQEAAEVVSVEVICMILLPLAVVLCFYALFVFLWRSRLIAFARTSAIHDRRGPFALSCVIVVALTAIFVLSLKDFVDTLATQGQSMAFVASSLGFSV